jgi:small subunit ribosomal protein S7
MSRRHAAEKREILPDAKFGDRVLSKFMNNLMVNGKKSIAEKIVYNALDRVEGKLKRAPVEVRPERREALAIRWLISASRGRNENTMEERLAGELMDAVNSRGSAVKKREDTHKMADANKAFSHYRW